MHLLRQLRHVAGFALALLLPALLAMSIQLDEPYLVFGTVMLVFPLVRIVFGAASTAPPTINHPTVTKLLDHLPSAYFAALLTVLAALLVSWHASGVPQSWQAALGWLLSLWMVLTFATCAAHALLHAQSPGRRVLGHLLSGVAGYPLLGYEHVRHHRLPGNTQAAEWPRRDESVWRFSKRRLKAIGTETLGPGGLLTSGDAQSPHVMGLRVAVGTSALTAICFTAAAGATGLLIYLAAAALVAFSIQLVTYMQHWGLGDDYLGASAAQGISWDSDCKFQVWLTFGLSLHQSHHDHGAMPYYQCSLVEGAPRHPAGYVLLMVVAFFPALWQRVMTPVLDKWVATPHDQPSIGRRLTCIAFYAD